MPIVSIAPRLQPRNLNVASTQMTMLKIVATEMQANLNPAIWKTAKNATDKVISKLVTKASISLICKLSWSAVGGNCQPTGRLTSAGAFILNTGDYMQRISNDAFPSTTHRVSVPADSTQLTPRVSFPLNFYLPEATLLAPLPCCGPPAPRYVQAVTALHFHTAITEKYYGDGYRHDGGDGGSDDEDQDSHRAAKL